MPLNMSKSYTQFTLTGSKIKKERFIENPITLYDKYVNAHFLAWPQKSDRGNFQGTS